MTDPLLSIPVAFLMLTLTIALVVFGIRLTRWASRGLSPDQQACLEEEILHAHRLRDPSAPEPLLPDWINLFRRWREQRRPTQPQASPSPHERSQAIRPADARFPRHSQHLQTTPPPASRIQL